jgi:hypothetical protein
MQAPPAAWFEDTKDTEDTADTKDTPPPPEPEWVRMLKVYQFLFDAHAKK